MHLSIYPEFAAAWLAAIERRAALLEIRLAAFPMWFRAKPGWTAGRGPLAEHLFYYCHQGRFQARFEDQTVSLSSGQLLWLRPGCRFEFFLASGNHPLIGRFRLAASRVPSMPVPWLFLPRASEARAWLDRVHESIHAPAPWKRPMIRAALVGWFHALAAAHAPSEPDSPRRLTSGQISRLEQFAASAGNRQINPGDLAAHLHLSRDYFNRLFRAAAGRSSERWLVERRILAAAERLTQSTRSISQVADEFGYRDVFFFSRQFKQVLGQSPRQWRSLANPAAPLPTAPKRNARISAGMEM